MRWTLPNILTLARICLTPVIALLPFIQGYWPKVIAFVIQYNKRDLPNAAPIKDLQAALNPGWPIDDAAQQKVTPDPAHPGEHLVEQAGGQWVGHASYVEAVAIRGDGVFDTLKSVSKLVLKTLS